MRAIHPWNALVASIRGSCRVNYGTIIANSDSTHAMAVRARLTTSTVAPSIHISS
jgi:hypothetical protein